MRRGAGMARSILTNAKICATMDIGKVLGIRGENDVLDRTMSIRSWEFTSHCIGFLWSNGFQQLLFKFATQL
jgi:hypothetical protein